jgi:hypothetical protein
MEGSTDHVLVHCGDCIAWWTHDDKPIGVRIQRTGLWASKDDEWFNDARYCAHHTVGPGADSVTFYPRPTHRTDACGSGETIEAFVTRQNAIKAKAKLEAEKAAKQQIEQE